MLFRSVLFVLLSMAPALASDLPEDLSGQDWFEHCRQLCVHRLSQFPFVAGHLITYAWRSQTGYLWDWENGNHAGDAVHTCVRATLYDKQGRLIENVTLMCSVTGREQKTETWIFGNREIAARFCSLAPEALREMDSRAPRVTHPQK